MPIIDRLAEPNPIKRLKLLAEHHSDPTVREHASEAAAENGRLQAELKNEQLASAAREDTLRNERDAAFAETIRLRGIIAAISKNWSEGWDGNFSANWKEEDAEPGYWLPSQNATAIERAMTGGSAVASEQKGKDSNG